MRHTQMRNGTYDPSPRGDNGRPTWNGVPYRQTQYGLGGGDITGTMRHDPKAGIVYRDRDTEPAVLARARLRAALST